MKKVLLVKKIMFEGKQDTFICPFKEDKGCIGSKCAAWLKEITYDPEVETAPDITETGAHINFVEEHATGFGTCGLISN